MQCFGMELLLAMAAALAAVGVVVVVELVQVWQRRRQIRVSASVQPCR